MAEPLFLIGAGFNIDANALVDFSDIWKTGDDQGRRPNYPRATDLAETCFTDCHCKTEDVERAFTEAYLRKDDAPLKRLVKYIERADYYIGDRLACLARSPYHEFLDRFLSPNYLTYNYDAFLEILLHKMGRWHPHSGFGFPAELPFDDSPLSAPYEMSVPSPIAIVHLHGSLYFYPKYGISEKGTGLETRHSNTEPIYTFDPHSIGKLFPGLRSIIPGLGYSWSHERFIPPLRHKRQVLEYQYYCALQRKALGMAQKCSNIVAIGYSFAKSDCHSYSALLKQIFRDHKELHIVSPDSAKVAQRLKTSYFTLSPKIKSSAMTFAQWVEAGYPKGSQ